MICVCVIGRIQVSVLCVCHWQDSGECCVCVIGRIQVSGVCVSLVGFR